MGVTLMLIVMCACIDFGRALNDVQVMADLTRQGSNLASRGTTLNEAMRLRRGFGRIRLGPGQSRQRDHYFGHERKQRL